ncbi:MAG TPA: hypothetical protein VH092_06715 [Urbifossiella sp.]|jgi:hypothetical protein|nr:hypothetical protein [Urbifossiella sp.]
MSPELETLDRLQGDDLPLTAVRRLYPDADRFARGVSALLAAGEVRLMAADGSTVPGWQWRLALADPGARPGVRVALPPAGARRIG